MLPHLLFQDLDLGVEGGDHRDLGPDGGSVGGGQRGRLAEVITAQRGQDRAGLARDVPAAGALERRGDLGAGQLRRPGRVRGLGQQFQHVGRVQVLERLQRGGKVLAQLVPQPLHRAGAVPDQRLVRPGHHLDALAFGGVTRGQAQLVRIGAHQVRQHVRVPAVALGARYAVPFPVPGRLQRVHREHRVPGRDQRRNPRAPVGLDPDHHLRVIRVLRQEPADQRMQLRHPGHPSGSRRFASTLPASSITSMS